MTFEQEFRNLLHIPSLGCFLPQAVASLPWTFQAVSRKALEFPRQWHLSRLCKWHCMFSWLCWEVLAAAPPCLPCAGLALPLCLLCPSPARGWSWWGLSRFYHRFPLGLRRGSSGWHPGPCWQPPGDEDHITPFPALTLPLSGGGGWRRPPLPPFPPSSPSARGWRARGGAAGRWKAAAATTGSGPCRRGRAVPRLLPAPSWGAGHKRRGRPPRCCSVPPAPSRPVPVAERSPAQVAADGGGSRRRDGAAAAPAELAPAGRGGYWIG